MTTTLPPSPPSWGAAFIALFLREAAVFTATPLAVIFLIGFWLAHGFCAFYLASFLESGSTDFSAIFAFHPWLWLFFAPALAQRLFPEERRSGTLESLLALPIPLSALLLAKYSVALLLCWLALAGTFPLWLTAAYLGQPDHGAIASAYLGSALLVAAMLALATTAALPARSQLSGFTLGLLLCFLFLLAGFPLLLDFLRPLLIPSLLQVLAGFGFLPHFESFTKGLLGFSAAASLLLHVLFWLSAGLIFLDGIRVKS